MLRFLLLTPSYIAPAWNSKKSWSCTQPLNPSICTAVFIALLPKLMPSAQLCRTKVSLLFEHIRNNMHWPHNNHVTISQPGNSSVTAILSLRWNYNNQGRGCFVGTFLIYCYTKQAWWFQVLHLQNSKIQNCNDILLLWPFCFNKHYCWTCQQKHMPKNTLFHNNWMFSH